MKRVLYAVVASLILVIAGFFFLAAGFRRTALVLVIYPGSLIAYLPGRVLATTSDAMLFYLGLLASCLFWFLIICLLTVLRDRLGFRQPTTDN
jgi:hypothetical protein